MIHVAVGLLINKRSVFIARRHQTAHQGGLWEFPGGKVDKSETAEVALYRELHEEIGISVDHAEPIMQIRHDYNDKNVLLDVWQIERYRGEPCGREGQPIRWLAIDELQTVLFPAANQAIVEWLEKKFN